MDVWGMIKAMLLVWGLFNAPVHAGVQIGGVWNGNAGGVWVDAWVGIRLPLESYCGVALPSVIVVDVNPLCDIPGVWHHELAHWRQWSWLGPMFLPLYAINPVPWEGDPYPWPGKPPDPPYVPVWPVVKWPIGR